MFLFREDTSLVEYNCHFGGTIGFLPLCLPLGTCHSMSSGSDAGVDGSAPSSIGSASWAEAVLAGLGRLWARGGKPRPRPPPAGGAEVLGRQSPKPTCSCPLGAGGVAQESCRSLDEDAPSEEFGRERGPLSLEGDCEALTGADTADPSWVGETACEPST